jgi:ABC-2 type transport system ATP-binding protein
VTFPDAPADAPAGTGVPASGAAADTRGTRSPGADGVLGGEPSLAVWCSGVSKRYGRRVALSSVSLSIRRGEIVGLLGPNGAGKTSLIKIMLGLVKADAGEVMLLGRRGDQHGARVGVGYLPELFRYQPWLTADEVLALHARLARVDATRAARLDLLTQVGLAARAGDRVGRFSKGMQQRLGLAVALLGEPQLVVLDEPTSALDPIGRVDVREIVRGLKARGAAVLLNSHLIGEVERVCDRVVILDHGHVAASGSLDELLGATEVRLHLEAAGEDAERLLAGFGSVSRAGDWVTVRGPDAGAVPDLVAGLVGLGVRVHAVHPGRQTLEDRLLQVLRVGDAGKGGPA